MRKPVAKDALKQLAESHGVCVRPLALRRTDTATGLTEVVEVPCGATLAVKCKPCAEKGRRLRIQQIREGWHLADEPAVRPDKPGEDALALVRVRAHLEFEREAVQYQPMTPDERAAQVAEIDAAIELDEALGDTSLRGHPTPKSGTIGPAASGPPGGVKTRPICPAYPSTPHGGPRLLGPGGQDLPAVDAGHADARLARAGALPPPSRRLRRAV
ncbi:replication initiator [Micromonospora sp. BRA006-A]|nr:replication initiator [Micromonospora sp. BRA006-A]